MIGELVILSVFVPPSLVFAVVAGAAVFLLRRLLSRTGFYRLIWHPGLFDLALFIVLWSGLSLVFDVARAGPVA